MNLNNIIINMNIIVKTDIRLVKECLFSWLFNNNNIIFAENFSLT